MDMDEETLGVSGESVSRAAVRLRASRWLWRPWYAKLWWVGSSIYWMGKLSSYRIPILDSLYSTALAGYLNIVFYPMTLLMVLGVGFARAWMDHKGLEWGPPTHEQTFPQRSVGGFRDRMADPLDPRSPSHWRYLDDIN